MNSQNSLIFSVIIPAFNEEKNIAGCLKSVINQDFDRHRYEVIVVNNNSTDKTGKIAQRFAVKVVNEPKQGYVFALIRGAQKARGEILVFTDADTRVKSNWLSQFEKIYQNPEIVCAGGGVRFEPRFFYVIIVEFFLNFAGRFLKTFSGFNLSIRRNIYEKLGGFNPKHNFNTDNDLVMRARKIGKMAFSTNNKVVTSSRHYRGITGFVYAFKGAINIVCLALLKRTLFYEFGNVRD